MKQNNKGMVEIPAVTLNALKGLLFSNDGVDLSAIINDLSIGLDEGRKDLMAINIALTFKGLKPEIEVPKISYKGDWRMVKVYFYQGFSLIEGVAAFEVHQIRWNDNGWKEDNKVYKEVFGLNQVDEILCTEVSEIRMQGIEEDETPDIEELVSYIEELNR